MNIHTHVQKSENKTHENPLVLVHGSWGSSMMWERYVQFFSQNGWNVYALDLRGHGKSDGTVAGATMHEYMDDVRHVVIDHRLADPILIGHSMGGLVALMYAVLYGTRAVVAIDPSPTKEVQGNGARKEYPSAYSPMDAGMPTDPTELMRALSDIPQESLMQLKELLGMESGVARSERKLGISIPKDKLIMPTLFVGSEYGTSVAFGIGIETARRMAAYYDKDVIEIQGATHPGILVGQHALQAAQRIQEWLSE